MLMCFFEIKFCNFCSFISVNFSLCMCCVKFMYLLLILWLNNSYVVFLICGCEFEINF